MEITGSIQKFKKAERPPNETISVSDRLGNKSQASDTKYEKVGISTNPLKPDPSLASIKHKEGRYGKSAGMFSLDDLAKKKSLNKADETNHLNGHQDVKEAHDSDKILEKFSKKTRERQNNLPKSRSPSPTNLTTAKRAALFARLGSSDDARNPKNVHSRIGSVNESVRQRLG